MYHTPSTHLYGIGQTHLYGLSHGGAGPLNLTAIAGLTIALMILAIVASIAYRRRLSSSR